MRRDQFAINAVSTQGGSLEESLAAYSEAGFRQVEFRLGPIKDWIGAHSLAEFKDLLTDQGIRAIGGFEAQALVFADEATRAANFELHRQNAELLDALGGGTLVIGTDAPAQPQDDVLDVIGQALGELILSFPESVQMALEFNWSPVVRSLKSAYLVALAADHPRVGILFDPAHYHCTPSKLEDLTPEVAARILHIHVDDMRDKPGDQSQCNSDRVLPGQGCLDLRELFGRIEAAGYRGWFSIELFNHDLWALPPARAAKLMYDSLGTLLG